jgi:hypothetical protein
MTTLRDIRRQSRRDLHALAKVPAVYVAYAGAIAVGISVRDHTKVSEQTPGDGVGEGWGGRRVPETSIVIDNKELAAPRRLAVIWFSASEAYRIDQVDPASGEFQRVQVARLSPSECSASWNADWEALLA